MHAKFYKLLGNRQPVYLQATVECTMQHFIRSTHKQLCFFATIDKVALSALVNTYGSLHNKPLQIGLVCDLPQYFQSLSDFPSAGMKSGNDFLQGYEKKN